MRKLFFSLVASLFLLGGCEKKVVCPDEEHITGLLNTQNAQSYHISRLYARIDSMNRELMRLEDSLAFNAPSDWIPRSVVSSPEDAGPYPKEKLKKVSYKDEYKRHVSTRSMFM